MPVWFPCYIYRPSKPYYTELKSKDRHLAGVLRFMMNVDCCAPAVLCTADRCSPLGREGKEIKIIRELLDCGDIGCKKNDGSTKEIFVSIWTHNME